MMAHFLLTAAVLIFTGLGSVWGAGAPVTVGDAHFYHSEKISNAVLGEVEGIEVDSFRPDFQVEAFGNTCCQAYLCLMLSANIGIDPADPLAKITPLPGGTVLNYANAAAPVTVGGSFYRVPLERVNPTLYEISPALTVKTSGLGRLAFWYEVEDLPGHRVRLACNYNVGTTVEDWMKAIQGSPDDFAGNWYYVLFLKKDYDYFQQCLDAGIKAGLCDPMGPDYPVGNFPSDYYSYDFSGGPRLDYFFKSKNGIVYFCGAQSKPEAQLIFSMNSGDENWLSYKVIINPFNHKPYLLVSNTADTPVPQSNNPSWTDCALFEYSSWSHKMKEILSYQGGVSQYSLEYDSKLEFTKEDEVTITYSGTNNPEDMEDAKTDTLVQVYKRGFLTGQYEKISGKAVSEVFN